MYLIRTAALALAVTLAFQAGPAANGQDAQGKRRPLAGGLDRLGGPLVSKSIELNLTAEQKDKIAKIEKEFADKAKEETRLQEAVKKAKEDKDRAAFQTLQSQITEAVKARAAFTEKIATVLNADQKKTFEQATGGAAAPGKRPVGANPGVTLPGVLERLDLTADQKEKLNKLQKDFEDKALQVLTEEQRKKYEELKKGKRRPQQSSRVQPRTPRATAAPATVSVAFAARRMDA